ncbi:hypothetical protein SAMN04488144_1594 [Methylobacterium sp. 190mf]|nr:hypothetical protein SAMN04488144_1594 [Methylobacterium sp. 190mf]
MTHGRSLNTLANFPLGLCNVGCFITSFFIV